MTHKPIPRIDGVINQLEERIMKKTRLLTQIGLLTTAPLALATQVNVSHLAPFADTLEGTAVSVNVNGTEVLNGVQYQQSSGYLELTGAGVAPGNTLLEVFAPPGSSDPAISADVDLLADTDYTVVAIGDGTNQPLELLPLIDNNQSPAAGNAKLRLVHSAPFSDDQESTAVSVRFDDGELFAGLELFFYGSQTDYIEVPAGTYDLNVSNPEGTVRLIDLAPVTLNDGDIVTVFATGDAVNQALGFYALFGDGTGAPLPTEPPFNTMNQGLNGAWVSPDVESQGFMIEVYPDLAFIFVAWYAFDTTFPDMNETAVVGDPNQRWLTASGNYSGTSAELTLYNSSGGIFNQSNTMTETIEIGTLRIDFNDCGTATVDYSIDGSELSGTLDLQRVSDANVAFCESISF